MYKPSQVPKKQNQRGAAMAEFVIVVPILIMILFSIIEFGLMINRVQTFNLPLAKEPELHRCRIPLNPRSRMPPATRSTASHWGSAKQ